MLNTSIFFIIFYFLFLLFTIKPLGYYIFCIYQNKITFLNSIESFIYRLCGINSKHEMQWKEYLTAVLIFNACGMIFLYGILRLQVILPFNPQHFANIPSELAFNIAVSFGTNTDWQAYSGEMQLSYFSQMLGITVQNFLSGATGIAVLIAFIRGLTYHESNTLGNFWVDLTRTIIYILLPLSLIFALFLTSQGVIQNLKPYEIAQLIQPFTFNNHLISEQIIPMGPAASQIAIKQLATNGGGFFNTNSAHPFENPTTLTNFFECLAILLLPAALCHTFGRMVKDPRQCWAILAAILFIFIPALGIAIVAEQNGNPVFKTLNIDQTYHPGLASGGNMEGKETRLGTVSSALWTIATTASANGSVNYMPDSTMPLTKLMSLWLMQIGEVVWGGVGTGLYNLLILIILTVFVAGLMVGRSPEYLGKKIDPFEIKMASLIVLITPLLTLFFTAIATFIPELAMLKNKNAHGFTAILYAFTSLSHNNGSVFSGLNTNTFFYNILGSIVMLIGRYLPIIAILAIAGSLVKKKKIPSSSGTLGTHTILFVLLLVSVICCLAGLSFFPALALGPIAEYLNLGKLYGF